MNVPIFVAVDSKGMLLVSHYPSNELQKTLKQNDIQINSEIYRKVAPEPPQIVEDFLQLFNGSDVNTSAVTSNHNAEDITHLMPNIVLYFMDPNACEAHVIELRKQGIEAHLKELTLTDYIQHLYNTSRDSDPLLLPLSEALIHATHNGQSVFKGTPLFTTDPPIAISKVKSDTHQFDMSTEKLVIFSSPEEAKEIYRKACSMGNTSIELNGETFHYKVLHDKWPWSPKILLTSLEALCQRIDTREPFWAGIIHIQPKMQNLNRNETSNTVECGYNAKSLWQALQRLISTVV
uniref:Uncharacterized protein n=2 Tax=Babesia bovis TaxID=5865 RepID=A7AW31_BABBO|eukprot:XP_001608827.1 hypothetical protein [Babesia bovis T2Bo]